MTLVLSFLIYEFQERSRAGSAQYWSFWWNKVDVVLFSLLITRGSARAFAEQQRVLDAVIPLLRRCSTS